MMPSRTITLISGRQKVLLLGIALNVLLIVTLTAGILWRRLDGGKRYRTPSSTAMNEYESAYLQSREVTILLILCGGGQDEVQNNGGRHKENAKVLLKSAAALALVPVRFIIVADPRSHFEELEDVTKGWPEEYRRKVRLHYVTPSHHLGNTQTGFTDQDCVTETLFNPDFLLQEDAVMYLANDVIFMRPPEDLWEAFSSFNSKQVVGLVPNFSSDDVSKNRKDSFSGRGHLNSGVLLMNLTRWRNNHGNGGLKTIAENYNQYIVTVFPAGHESPHAHPQKVPKLFFELECEWNFHRFHCKDKKNDCLAASREGASIVHGIAGAFQDENEMKFKVFYDTWHDHELNTPLIDLYGSIRENLRKVGMNQSTALCGDVQAIDVALSQQLRNAILRNPYLI